MMTEFPLKPDKAMGADGPVQKHIRRREFTSQLLLPLSHPIISCLTLYYTANIQALKAKTT